MSILKRCPSCDAEFSEDIKYCPQDGSVLRSSSAEASKTKVGQIVDGKYRVLEKLGGGGMGAVYKAEHILLKQIVALKVLHTYLLDDKEYLERFQREARTAFKIKHPNAITLHDFGVENDFPYLAMEFVDGETLKELLEKTEVLDTESTYVIISQIAAALAEAHSMGVVHRDIKPENIMVSKRTDGSLWAQMLDFGIAKLLQGDDNPNITKAGTVFGSPRYMAPEQATSSNVDARSDLYALGVMIYEMLCGKPLFDTATSIDLIYKHVNVAPKPLRDVAKDNKISAHQNYVVMKLLEKDPAARYQSIEEFLEEFEPAFNPNATLSAIGTDRIVTRKRRIVGNMLIGSLFVLACALGGMLLIKKPAANTETEAELQERLLELEELAKKAEAKQAELEAAERLSEEKRKELELAAEEAKAYQAKALEARAYTREMEREAARYREQRVEEEKRVSQLQSDAQRATEEAKLREVKALAAAEQARKTREQAEKLAEKARREAEEIKKFRVAEEKKTTELGVRATELSRVAEEQQRIAEEAAKQAVKEKAGAELAQKRARELEQQAGQAETKLKDTEMKARTAAEELQAQRLETERLRKQGNPPTVKTSVSDAERERILSEAKSKRLELDRVRREAAAARQAAIQRQRELEVLKGRQLAEKERRKAASEARQAELQKRAEEEEDEELLERRRRLPRQGKRR